MAAQRFALAAGGRAGIRLESRKNPKRRKMLENGAESHQSAARFVRRFRVAPDSLLLNQNHNLLDNILQRTHSLATPKFDLPKDPTARQRLHLTDQSQLF